MATVLAAGALAAPLAVGHSNGAGQAPAGGSSGYIDKGDDGPQVAQVQQALGLAGDGVFGPDTRAAVQQFQERNGLVVDGIVGPQTLGALGLGSAPATQAPQTQQPEQAPQPEQQKQQPAEPAPEPQPEQSSGGSGGGGGDQSSGGGSESAGGSTPPGVLQDIAQCESGGDPGAVSSDGQYRGKYQFDRQTWQGLGGSGDPAQASEGEQDRLAQQLLEQSGTDPWAGCL